jgi:hypothetical protein
MAKPNIDELESQFVKIRDFLDNLPDISKKLNANELANNFDKIQSAIAEIKDSSTDLLSLSTTDKKTTELIKKYNDALKDAIKQKGKLTAATKRSLPAWADNTSRITDLVNKMQDYYKGAKQVIKNNKELQAGLVLLTLTSTAFSKSLKFAGGVISSILKGAYKFVEYMTTMPIKVGEYAGKMGNTLRQELVEVIGQATEGAKEFFDLSSNGGEAISRLGSIAGGALGSFQSVNSELTKTFGPGATGAANMVSQLSQGINNMGVFADVFAKSTTNSTQSILFFQRMTKGMGMSAEDTSYIVAEAMKNGEHYFETMTRVKESSDAASKEFGINRKRLTMGFFNLRKDITQFGHLSEPALMAVVGKATQLGVSMESLKGVFSKFDTFENAAQSAAVLQQTFGMNIDALQLIRAENPMQIVEMFRESMMMTGRSFDDLNRHEKSLMATHTGMSAETLKTVMNYRNVGKSYADIKKIMNDQKPEERQIKAMKDMRSQMVETRKVIEGKGFFDNFLEGVGKTIKYNTELGKTYVKVSQRMEDFYEKGLSFSKKQKQNINKTLAPFNNILKGLISKDGPFSKKSFDGLKKEVTSSLGEFMDDVFGHKGKARMNWIKAQSKWQKRLRATLSFEKLSKDQTFLGKIFRSSGKIIGTIITGLVVGLPAVLETVGTIFTDGLSGLDSLLSEDSNMSKSVMSWLGFEDKDQNEMFGAIKRGIKDLKRIFIGEGKEEGIVVRAMGKIMSIAENIGNRIMEGLKNNKDAIAELTDQLSFGFFSKFMAYAARNPLFTEFINESTFEAGGHTLGEGTIKRFGLDSAVKVLNNDTIGRNIGGVGDETQYNVVGTAAGIDMGTVKTMLNAKQRGFNMNNLSQDDREYINSGKGRAQVFRDDLKEFAEGQQTIMGTFNRVIRDKNRAEDGYDLEIGDVAVQQRDTAQRLKTTLGAVAFNELLGQAQAGQLENVEIAFSVVIKKLAKVFDERGKRLKSKLAAFNKSIEDKIVNSDKLGENTTAKNTIESRRFGVSSSDEYTPRPSDIEKYRIETGYKKVEHASLKVYNSGKGITTELASRIQGLVEEKNEKIRDGGISKDDFEKLFNSQETHIQEMKNEYLESMKQNKDKHDHVVVTIDGYEVTSHVTRIQQEQQSDASKATASNASRARLKTNKTVNA